MRTAFGKPVPPSLPEIRGVSGWEGIAPCLPHIPKEIWDVCEKCESPIEHLMVMAFAVVNLSLSEMLKVKIDTQVAIGKYRADIVLTENIGDKRIVIECDGAEFHTDTEKDAKRTEEIEKLGYQVFRVSGSAIHHNPIGQALFLLRVSAMIPLSATGAKNLQAFVEPL